VAQARFAYYPGGKSERIFERRKVEVAMPKIDLTTEIHIVHGPRAIEVLIPMAGRPTHHWQVLFRKKAKTAQIDAAVDDKPDRFWILLRVPVGRDHRQIIKIMDGVRTLIDDVNANEHSQAAIQAEAVIRNWWAQQQ
jgi:hypothetical protein